MCSQLRCWVLHGHNVSCRSRGQDGHQLTHNLVKVGESSNGYTKVSIRAASLLIEFRDGGVGAFQVVREAILVAYGSQ